MGAAVDKTQTEPTDLSASGSAPAERQSASVSLALSSVPQATLSPLSLKSGYEEWVCKSTSD